MNNPTTSNPDPDAILARLADGSLPDEQQFDLLAEVAQSPELAAALAEQRRAVSLLQRLDDSAPASLRAHVREAVASAESRSVKSFVPIVRRRAKMLIPVTAALACVVVAFSMVLGEGQTPVTLPQTVHLALAASTRPAPAREADGSRLRDVSVDHIAFPDYQQSTGWRAVGSRSDTLGGRRIVTVFYTRPARRVGYAIVPGKPLAVSTGTTVSQDGTRYTLQQRGPIRLVTWLRSGHTCLIAGSAVTDATLLTLATNTAPTYG
jgi:hypothetical protein